MRCRVGLATLALLVLLAGCAIRPRSPSAATSAAGDASLLAPSRVRIHPLTRRDRDARGRDRLICYIEFLDQWDDTCKAVGQLQVQLYRPVEGRGGRASGLGVQELVWDANLADPQRQKDLYDRATRLYRLVLDTVPEWAAAPAVADAPTARLRAVFTPAGDDRTLQAELSLSGGRPVP
ncbi:MAG: hypothetical protein ACKVW3_12585 [Phycisphaerales bacterium]